MKNKPKLLDYVRREICLRHYSIRTAQANVSWIRRYILFHHKRHPKEMGKKEIEEFLSHLAKHRKVAASTQNQAFNALIFLYRQVLNLDVGDGIKAPLKEHLRYVKRLHDNELTKNLGQVYLPYALARKYPTSDRQWAW